MPDRTVSWAAWGWIALLGVMLIVPLLGIIFDRAASVVAVAVPLVAGAFTGFLLTISALYFRKLPWWGPVALAGLAIMVVLFHRQIGLLMAGTLIGFISALLREPLWRYGLAVTRWMAAWRRGDGSG